MKERIEKKLGCTIEEFKKRLDKHMKKYEGYETDMIDETSDLTYEELEYLGEYMTDIAKKSLIQVEDDTTEKPKQG